MSLLTIPAFCQQAVAATTSPPEPASNILKEFWPDPERKFSRKHK